MNHPVVSFLAPGISFWVRSDSGSPLEVLSWGFWLLRYSSRCSAQQSPGWPLPRFAAKTDTLDYVRIYGWIAGAINVVLLTCLAILCPMVGETTGRYTLYACFGERSATPQWFWPLVIVAMATTFFYSLPWMLRMGFGRL